MAWLRPCRNDSASGFCRIFLKWSLITLICGAGSFILAYLKGASPSAMILAMLSLALLLTFMEKSAFFQRWQLFDSWSHHALRWGIGLRLIWAATWLLVNFAVLYLPFLKGTAIGNALAFFAMAMLVAEGLIGSFAVTVVQEFLGVDPIPLYESGRLTELNTSVVDVWFASYSATIITGGMHIIVLMILCLLIDGGLHAGSRMVKAVSGFACPHLRLLPKFVPLDFAAALS